MEGSKGAVRVGVERRIDLRRLRWILRRYGVGHGSREPRCSAAGPPTTHVTATSDFAGLAHSNTPMPHAHSNVVGAASFALGGVASACTPDGLATYVCYNSVLQCVYMLLVASASTWHRQALNILLARE